VVETIYEPRAYFDRARRAALEIDGSKRRYRQDRVSGLKALRAFLRFAFVLGIRRNSRRHFWRALYRVARGNPGALYHFAVMCAMYIHVGPFAKFVAAKTREAIALERQARRAAREGEQTIPAAAPTAVVSAAT
jgi:hypothetical protein